MTDEKLKKIERIRQSLDKLRDGLRNNSAHTVDGVLIEEIDWLVSELTASWESQKEALGKEIKRLQAIDDFESGC